MRRKNEILDETDELHNIICFKMNMTTKNLKLDGKT